MAGHFTCMALELVYFEMGLAINVKDTKHLLLCPLQSLFFSTLASNKGERDKGRASINFKTHNDLFLIGPV